MKRFIVYLFIACSVIASSGCAIKSQVGTEKLTSETDASVAQKIKKGKTTKAQIRQEWGTPMDSEINADGGETWAYIFSKAKAIPFGTLIGKSPELYQSKLTVIFDKKAIVSNYSFSRGEIK